ncbi:MAG: FAD-binding oxidoreductase [Acidobacteria bacterium]|nr:FAD-binding oxidoreductase [Acidobacteriota bacterium]
MARDVTVLIIGAGFAGASTAFHLSRSFSGTILLIDKEPTPGFHASGRNASLVLQSTENPTIRRFIAESRRHLASQAASVGFHECGSVLLGNREQLERARETGLVPSEYCRAEELCAQVPLLKGHRFESALWTPSDGVIDISALLNFYVEGARSRGVVVRLQCEVKEIRKNDGYLIETNEGSFQAEQIVNAAGAWAPQIASMAGATSLPLLPLKRHLFVLSEVGNVEPHWPFIWNLQENFYFRPEMRDVLFSLCDEELTETLEPTVSPGIGEDLADLIWSQLPAMHDAVQKRAWSCFRTKAPDANFVIGPDPQLENFFWVAGLGGHGVGGSWYIGNYAAELLLQKSAKVLAAFSPSRFFKPSAEPQP